MSHKKITKLEEVKKFLREDAAPRLRTPTSPIDIREAMQQPIVGYRMLGKMGSGGMGTVFKAENMSTKQTVALKLLYPTQNQKVIQQFITEGMMLMSLDHPNILKGLDFGVSNGFYFLALEYIEGESLVPFIDQGFIFTEKYTFEVAQQIAEALAYLEEKKIVHRDVKPANILLVEDKFKLCDFAFALDIKKTENLEGESDVTCGTIEYISPEQARGKKNLDIRSDIYSLGITCIHMMTGELPFQDEEPREIMRRHIYDNVELDSIPNISSTGRRILKLMVAKNRKKRVLASKLAPLLKKVISKKYQK